MTEFAALTITLIVVVIWIDSLGSRERALALCGEACARRQLQLLDQSVALRRLGLAWKGEGLRLRRVYRFEFSEEGNERRCGYLVLRGQQLEELSFGLPSRIKDV